MTTLDATKESQAQQTEPVVFLWSVRRQHNLKKTNTLGSGHFGAFGKLWALSFQQYSEDTKAFGVFLEAKSPGSVATRFDTLVRKELSGPDLYRCSHTKTFDSDRDWGRTCNPAEARQLGVEDSMVVGVAIFPPDAPESDKLYVPPKTATSTFMHQAEGQDTWCVFVHQMPLLEYGIFPHLFGSSTRSDITFIIEDQVIPAHANILLTERAGPYFAGLLSHQFKENTDGKVHINGVPHKIFKAILEYVYTGRAAVDSALELCALYCAADRFQVTTLQPYIKGELIRSLKESLPEPPALLTLIQQMKAFPELSDAVRLCVDGVMLNWKTAKTSDNWRDLVTGTEVQDFIEVFLDEASELYPNI
ncbi:hypothetical protein HK104_000393, partial [Borealophlyctis nickersoniae]